MIEIALLTMVFFLGTAIANYRDRKGPVFGGVAVLAYIGGAMFGPVFIAGVIGRPWKESGHDPVIGDLYPDEYYMTALICALTASAAVMVLPLLLPRGRSYSGQRPTTRVPYGVIGTLVGLSGVAMLTRGSLIGAFWGFAMIGVTKHCFELARRQKARTGETALSTDARPPVLFLRSFGCDESLAAERPKQGVTGNLIFDAEPQKPNDPFMSMDEFLCDDIELLLGPLVALGNPSDYLPTLGASKIYRDHENWRDTFSDLARRAQAVLVLEGAGDGLLWELSYLHDAVPPERVFVLTKQALRSPGDWPETRSSVAKTGILLPETDPGQGVVLAFDSTWKGVPIISDAKTALHYVSSIDRRLSLPASSLEENAIATLHGTRGPVLSCRTCGYQYRRNDYRPRTWQCSGCKRDLRVGDASTRAR